MNQRPMKGLIDALRALGAEIRCLGAEGFFPVEIHASGLRGGLVEIDSSESSQMLSALLMVAPLADQAVEVHAIGGVRWPFVSMTARIMAAFQPGAEDNVERVSDTCFRVRKGGVPAYSAPSAYAIEPDASAASYYAALPFVVGGRLRLDHLHFGLQGDTAFLDVLARAGATVNATTAGFEVTHDLSTPRRGVDENFNTFSDTFLTLAALSPLLSGPTFITGIAHTRRQETDRVAGMAAELRRLGQEVLETEDTLVITPRPLLPDVTVRTYHDHRFAMSFGILGCHDLRGDGRPWLTIENAACCAKTFPHFFDLLESLRRKTSAP
jgi:3-phosphoshikimate 1-carboxyvinyltransferase